MLALRVVSCDGVSLRECSRLQGLYTFKAARREEPVSTLTPGLPLTAAVRPDRNHSFMKRFLLAIA